MKICIAQTKPAKGDVNANIKRHMDFIKRAAAVQAVAIFFPELSLTGYEPELAKHLATDANNTRLDQLQLLSNEKSITVCAGIPTISTKGIHISMLIFQPHQSVQTYLKQILHGDEKPYFVKGEKDVIISINELQIAPAICHESLQPQHAEKAMKQCANMYVASVAKSLAGVTKAHAYYSKLAHTYSIPVLKANSVGPCDNFVSGGKSAAWSAKGKLLTSLDDKHEGIIFYDTVEDKIVLQQYL